MAVDITKDKDLAPVRITVEVPGRLARDIEELVSDTVYLTTGDVIRA